MAPSRGRESTYKHFHAGRVHLDDVRVVRRDVRTDVAESVLVRDLVVALQQAEPRRRHARAEEGLHPPTARADGRPVKAGEFYCRFSANEMESS